MISIVIPAYNREVSLKKCVSSIICQHFEGLEIIVVDDCSADTTSDYLKLVCRKYPFVKMSRNDINKGVNYSRNRGIEMATRPYILFLDSDDELSGTSLSEVRDAIYENPSTNHFLFVVSDRKEEFAAVTQNRQVQYEDWISGKVQGDFIHVVNAAIMKQFPFFEQFRTFEHLNWLRVKKSTAPQLLVPVIAALRERNREDCLTNSMQLKNAGVIRSKFESEKMFYSMYYNDLKLHNPASLSNQLLQAITLGVACNKKTDSRSLTRYAGKLHIKLAANILLLFPSSMLQYLIVRYSAIRNR
jgi:glycosyltransferase involved in cell wall biosynthesis